MKKCKVCKEDSTGYQVYKDWYCDACYERMIRQSTEQMVGERTERRYTPEQMLRYACSNSYQAQIKSRDGSLPHKKRKT